MCLLHTHYVHLQDVQAKTAAVALIQHTKQRPQHHSFIHSMHSRYTVYGPVVRLALKWINTHMLSNHIPVEAVELLVASLWTQSSPLQLPNSVLSGFMRFLVLLCSHDWQQAPLIVDFYNELSSSDIAAISESCASCRARGGLTSSTSNSTANSNVPQTAAPAHCSMYLIASYDKTSNSGSSNSSTTSSQQWIPSWTKTTPEHAVLGRLKAVAHVSLSTLLQWITSTATDSSSSSNSSSNTAAAAAHETASVSSASGWQSVFKLSNEEVATFNVKIKINSMLCADNGNCMSGADTLYKHKVKGCKALRLKLYKNMATGLHASQLYIGFEPVHELVRELQARYGHVALFMYNSMAPNAIGIVWRPSAYTQSTFNAMNSRYCMPIATDSGSTSSSSSSSSVLAKGTQVVPNVTQILAEIQALGGDMIESIHITQ
jgi:U3 small nucleolar RNA-associated protein 22